MFAKFWFQYVTSFAGMSFVDHLKLRVEEGISIGRAGRGGGAPISGIFIYILWLVEFGVVAGLHCAADDESCWGTLQRTKRAMG